MIRERWRATPPAGWICPECGALARSEVEYTSHWGAHHDRPGRPWATPIPAALFTCEAQAVMRQVNAERHREIQTLTYAIADLVAFAP